MKEIPLIILYDERSNTSRAYIEYLKRNNFKAKKIVVLKFKSEKTKKLGRYIGDFLAYKVFEFYIKVHRFQESRVHAYSSEVQNGFEEIKYHLSVNLADYAQEVDVLYLDSFIDDKLRKYVLSNIENFFLYTAGGIVPKAFLEIDDLKLLHIHPGVVPQVKGSDGFFWSVLTQGCPGASCFYMDATIDTGDVINTKSFDVPEFSKKLLNSLTYNEIYKAILQYYDPHLRATLLIETIQKTNNLQNVVGVKQDPNAGCTYFTMHEKLIKETINKVLK